VLIGMNAFFVAAEYAVVALRPAQIDTLRAGGWRRTAAAVEALKARPADAIGTIQVCITMTNLMLGGIGEPAMSALLLAAFRPLEHLSPAVVSRGRPP
jgi:CBS domain containing-hemolysin-like protein